MVKHSRFIRWGAAACALVLVPGLVAAQQQPEEIQAQQRSAQAQALPLGQTINVNEHFVRRTGNNCEYVADVRGSIRVVRNWPNMQQRGQEEQVQKQQAEDEQQQQLQQQQQQQQQQQEESQRQGEPPMQMQQGMQGQSAQDIRPPYGVSYIPRLSIDARLSCRQSQVQHRVSSALTGVRLSARQLEGAVEANGTIRSFTGPAQICTYSPDFAFQYNRLVGRSLAQACTRLPYVYGGGPRQP